MLEKNVNVKCKCNSIFTYNVSFLNLMHGWYTLVVTQPSTSHQLVCVCALLCLVRIIAAHLGNKVIFHQLSPQTLLVTVNSCNVTQIILSSSVPETVSTRENKSQKCRWSWGANPWHPALRASALDTRPPWIDFDYCRRLSLCVDQP